MAAGQFFEAHAARLETLEHADALPLAARVALTATCARLENLLGQHQTAHLRLTGALEGISDTRSGEAVVLMTQLMVDGLYHLDHPSARRWGEQSARRSHGGSTIRPWPPRSPACSRWRARTTARSRRPAGRGRSEPPASTRSPTMTSPTASTTRANALAAAEIRLDRLDVCRRAQRARACDRDRDRPRQRAAGPVLDRSCPHRAGSARSPPPSCTRPRWRSRA